MSRKQMKLKHVNLYALKRFAKRVPDILQHDLQKMCQKTATSSKGTNGKKA